VNGGPYWSDGACTLYLGDALDVLREMPGASVDCCVTSPPYFWLRDYGVEGQYGLEESPDAYVAQLVQVFAEVRRVLADDGTLWLNLGDSYYSAKGLPHGDDAKQSARRFGLRVLDAPGLGVPRKSLLGIPWRVVLALQADDWTLRSAVIWRRPTASPEPTAKDRPWRTTEHLFLLAKNPRYWFDRSALGGDEDVWTIEPDRSTGSGDHAAPFPLALPRRCIAAGCRPGGTVLDPFSGSGTSGEAAIHLGCRYIGIDLNPAYHDLAVKRYAQGVLSFGEAS
jgi:DNA modification methylase